MSEGRDGAGFGCAGGFVQLNVAPKTVAKVIPTMKEYDRGG
jgi:hypothetical protein